MRSPAIVRVAFLVLALAANVSGQEGHRGLTPRLTLPDGWLIKSAAEVMQEGDAISAEAFVPEDRKYQKEGMQDVGLAMFIGYDCMGTAPDRNMGLWQDVYLEFRGSVAIRDPFVVSQLPLPQTSPAALQVSATLVNSTGAAQEGVLKGTIAETGGPFEKKVSLAPGETKRVVFSADEHPAQRIDQPRLWWPRNYGPQNLYHLVLQFETAGQPADQQQVSFGICQVTRELHKLDGAHGLRVHVNGQKIFCRGGYIQPELLFGWDAKRIEAEIRYLAEANINLVYFEDIPNPPDVFLDLCDKYGVAMNEGETRSAH